MQAVNFTSEDIPPICANKVERSARVCHGREGFIKRAVGCISGHSPPPIISRHKPGKPCLDSHANRYILTEACVFPPNKRIAAIDRRPFNQPRKIAC